MMSDQGLLTIPSAFSVRETIDRLEKIVTSKGLSVFARIDHAAGAAQVGMPLRPTELLIFGNARGGTPLMQDKQTTGIDLPLKMLAWEDAGGAVWLTYNDLAWLAQRHGLGAASRAAVAALTAAMATMAASVARPDTHDQETRE
jgi:uncharacterized protein (DUF302 family)